MVSGSRTTNMFCVTEKMLIISGTHLCYMYVIFLSHTVDVFFDSTVKESLYTSMSTHVSRCRSTHLQLARPANQVQTSCGQWWCGCKTSYFWLSTSLSVVIDPFKSNHCFEGILESFFTTHVLVPPPSRSVCHGPLRQQALFRTCLALFRDILLFFGGHFGSEVSCGSSMASVSWASLLGGEPCSTLTQDTFTWFFLSLCCQIGPVFSVPLRHQTSSHRRHGLGILHRGMTAAYVMLTNTFYRASCSCKCRIRPCICPLHAWWISRMTNFECLSCFLALPFGTVEMTDFECVLCSCSSVQLPMSFFVRHESKQMAPEWMEAPFTTPSSC